MVLRVFIFIIGLIAMTSCSNQPFQKYETKIDITINDIIQKEELNIIVNPYGYLLNGYEPDKYIGSTDRYIVLYKESKTQDYTNAKINKYSDYYIYAKYKNRYAKMKYTNSLVMGSEKTDIKIFLNTFNEIKYLSSSMIVPSIETITQNSFKDKQTFKDNKQDMKMLEYLDKL